MPLDRSWFNTLVDDDGSNNVGSVWNKASVDHIYDDVDAALLPLDAKRTNWAAFVGDAVGNNLVQAGTNLTTRYAKVGDLLFWTFFGISLQLPVATAHIGIGVPGGILPLGTGLEQNAMRAVMGGSTNAWVWVEMNASGYLQVYPGALAQWPAGTLHLIGQGFYFWR